MTDAEHLAKIEAKCRVILAGDYRPDTSLPACMPTVTRALALSTLAAIDGLRDEKVWNERVGEYVVPQSTRNILDAIRAAWPEELL